MTDVVSPAKRSRMMAGIKGKNTKPELIIRKGLFNQGFRYRLHRKDIPGKPDLVLARYNAVIFVHGCFWHQHDCHLFKWPKQNIEFWREKLGKNLERDRRNQENLYRQGWRVCTIWECALRGRSALDTNQLLGEVSSWLTDGPDKKLTLTGMMTNDSN